ncbi:esterase [Pseudomonas aeruginosa]|uniref:hypothetical protein n=1 Tax=Pseudomonas nitroreducens TaxID=46680 RepID=UPI00351CC90A|nr:esterase [Pseudomonas aeruginosa]
MGIFRFAVAIMMVTAIAGCSLHKQWRGNEKACVVAVEKHEDFSGCNDAQIQVVAQNGDPKSVLYKIGFVEFDDQGQLFKRSQMNTVLSNLQEDAGKGDVLIVVYAHGWEHRAKEGDGNIDTFRKVLKETALKEQVDAVGSKRVAREVFGIYVGWRGLSVLVPGIQILSFWDRKNTAAKVGAGDVTELLSEVELVKRTRDAIKVREQAQAAVEHCIELGANKDLPEVKQAEDCSNALSQSKTAKSDTRLVVIGHSFGGLVVQSAIDRILIDRAVRTSGADSGYQGNIEGFGNLVVLINPAFEAQRFNSMFQLQKERATYQSNQLPVELVLTSQTDYPTKLAFPAGRILSSGFEKRGWSEKNVKALGHYGEFITHSLEPVSEDLRKSPRYARCFDDPKTIAQSWFAGDRKQNKHILGGLILERTQLSERAPFLNVTVSGKLIADHNDLYEEPIIEFASRMISLSSITEGQKMEAAAKAMTVGEQQTCDL